MITQDISKFQLEQISRREMENPKVFLNFQNLRIKNSILINNSFQYDHSRYFETSIRTNFSTRNEEFQGFSKFPKS